MFLGSAAGLLGGMAFTLLLACACLSDLLTRRIPNPLVAILMVLGLAFSAITGSLPHGIVSAVAGIVVGLLVWLPFWLLGWLGAGDVKLFAAAAAWLGPWGALEAAGIGALIGFALAVGWLGWEKGIRVAVEKSLIATIHPKILASPSVATNDRRRLVPYGIALAAGLLIAGWFPSLLF
jgi:prepilin peptidase CpaA